MGLRRKGRVIAFQALYFWDVTHPELSELLRFDWLDDADSDRESGEQSRTFARLILSGVLEHIDSVDDAIRRQLEHWDFSRLSWVDRAILRLGTYELLFARDIPPSVTIDEAIGIAKQFGADESFRFINGVLDAVKRESSET
ncbi:MAG: transcription antitermination factor NusB [Spirochaetaceae bacterium]